MQFVSHSTRVEAFLLAVKLVTAHPRGRFRFSSAMQRTGC